MATEPLVIPATNEERKDYLSRQVRLHKQLLEDVENATKEIREKKAKQKVIEDQAYSMLQEAIEERAISPYKACIAYSKLVDSRYKMERTAMELLDRVSGVMGGFVTEEDIEPEETEVYTPDMQRAAEKALIQMMDYKARIEKEKKENALKESQTRKEA